MAAALGGAVEQESSRLMCMLEHLVHEISDMLIAANTGKAKQCDVYVPGQLGGFLGSFLGGGGVKLSDCQKKWGLKCCQAPPYVDLATRDGKNSTGTNQETQDKGILRWAVSCW